MAHKWGIRLWGGAGEDLLDADLNPWVDSVGALEHTVGGHTPLQMGAPNQLNGIFIGNATKMVDDQNDITRQAYLSVYGPCGADTPADYHAAMDNGDYERIIFAGTYGDYNATLPEPANGAVQWAMQGNDSKVFNRRPGIAQDLNADFADVLTAIEGAVTFSPTAEHDRFPDAVAGYLQDMPASDDDSIGTILSKLSAPYGMWVGVEWSHSLDASDELDAGPTMIWRPSWFTDSWRDGGADTTGVEIVTVNAPWVLRYTYGRQYAAHPSKVTVTGTGAVTGSFSHASGYQTGWAGSNVSSYIDNNTEAANSAEHLAKMCGLPYPRIIEATLPLEMGYRKMVAAGVSTDDAEAVCWKIAAARIGDRFIPSTETADPGGDAVEPPVRHGRYATDELLTDVVRPYFQAEAGDSPARINGWTISKVTRTWSPHTGLTVTLGLMGGFGGDWS